MIDLAALVCLMHRVCASCCTWDHWKSDRAVGAVSSLVRHAAVMPACRLGRKPLPPMTTAVT